MTSSVFTNFGILVYKELIFLNSIILHKTGFWKMKFCKEKQFNEYKGSYIITGNFSYNISNQNHIL